MSIESIIASHIDLLLLLTLVATFWVLPGDTKRLDDLSTSEEGVVPDQR